jgi:hypothetical protein
MSDILNISRCNIAQGIGEANRFLFHVMLVHVATCIIEGKQSFFGEELFRTLLITAMAITMYHVFFRKIIEPKVEKMKLICYEDIERISKKDEIDKQYQSIDFTSDTIDTESENESNEYTEIDKDNRSEDDKIKKTDKNKKSKYNSRNTREKTKRKNVFTTPRNYSKRQ